ncbi:hypothetical protein M3Y98_00213300 [Aphelenchoides besseyi]|nr:hypothetical protein M3Y98_00213300 [Aphelenchoides besseyi]KAI6200414.1 hypothetical protein M3Y96_00731200 [Aphelenchoides besseyi]
MLMKLFIWTRLNSSICFIFASREDQMGEILGFCYKNRRHIPRPASVYVRRIAPARGACRETKKTAELTQLPRSQSEYVHITERICWKVTVSELRSLEKVGKYEKLSMWNGQTNQMKGLQSLIAGQNKEVDNLKGAENTIGRKIQSFCAVKAKFTRKTKSDECDPVVETVKHEVPVNRKTINVALNRHCQFLHDPFLA